MRSMPGGKGLRKASFRLSKHCSFLLHHSADGFLLRNIPNPPSPVSCHRCPRSSGFPDGTECEPKQWNDVLPMVVERLNRSGLLAPGRNVPVRMSRGKGYLINTEPFHSDGRPMGTRIQTNGPDRLWVQTLPTASHGHYGVYHAKRLLQYCNQPLERVYLWLGEPSAEDNQGNGPSTGLATLGARPRRRGS